MSDKPDPYLDKLIEDFKRDTESYEANKALALYLSGIRKHQLAAEPHLMRALRHGRIDADTPYMMEALGNIMILKGQFEPAAGLYAKAHELFPEMKDFAFRLGDCLFRLGRLEEASQVFSEANEKQVLRAKENSDGQPVFLLGPNKVICRFIGEMAAKIDLFVKARKLGLIGPSRAILLAPEEDVVNPSLLEYWREHIEVVTDPDEISDLTDRYGDNWYYMDYVKSAGGQTLRRDFVYRSVQKMWTDQGDQPLLKLTEDHIKKGRDYLRGLGVPEDAWFVSLHVREQGYHGELDVEWSRSRYRNGEIESYLPAIREITGRGGWVVRLGDPSMTPLPEMEGVVDYAHSEDHTDWKDIYLMAACKFLIASASGPHSVAVNFGVPILSANWFPLGIWPHGDRDIIVHKLFRDRGDGRTLGMSESLTPPLLGTLEPEYFNFRGLDVIDNSEEDILEAVVEMLERIDGDLVYSPEDNARQEVFAAKADPHGMGMPARAARGFLSRHPELLE